MEPTRHDFATTRWSQVLLSADPSDPSARDALSYLCRTYWRPVYAFIRRRGFQTADAQDLTQDFFARLVDGDRPLNAAPEKGRFRSYLLGAVKHLLANELDRRKAEKRGGGVSPISIDELNSEEGRQSLEPVDETTAEALYDRQWALELLDKTLSALEAEFVAAGKKPLFERLKPLLTADGDTMPYKDIAAEFNASEGAVKVAVHRMRRRYRELLRQEIASTINDPADADDEIRHLIGILAH